MGVTQHTVHDAKTGRINLTTNAFHPRSSVVGDVLTCICVDPGQEKGYVGYLSGRMTVFSADTSTDVSWPAHKSKVTQLLFLPSDKPGGKANLWSSSTDGFIKLWDGTRAAAKGSGHRGDILDMVYVPFAAGGGVIWTGGADKSIRVWDRTGTAAAGTGSARRQTQLRCLESVCGLIPDEEQQVVWSCDKANLRAWSADTRNCVWTGMRGGVAFALCGQYVVALIDGGASIGVWDRTLDLETETEIPPRTVFAVPDKGISKMLTFTPDSLLLPAAHGLTIIQLEEYAVDASVEIVIEKAIDESVGAIFRADKNLVLERVEPGSAAERCGGVRFLGRTLTHVNGTPVQTVGDVRASVRRQTSFSMKFAPGGNQQNGSAPVHLAVTPAIRRVPSINVTGMNGAAASHTNSNTNSNNLAAPAQPLQKKLSGLGFPSRRDHAPLPDRALTDKHAQPKNSKKKLERRGSNPVLISPAHKDFIQLDDIPPRSPTRKDVKKSSKTQISPGQREVLETVRSITAATETTTDSELASLLKAYVDKLHDDKKKLERDVKDAQSAASDAGESCKELERTKREAKGKLDELEKTVQECKADTLKYKGQLHKVQQTKEQLTQQLTEKEKAIRSFESRLQNNDTLGQSLRETLQRTLNPQLQEIIRSLEGIKRVNDYIEPTVTEISRSVKASSLHGSKGDIRLDLVSPLKKPAKSKTTSPHIGPKSMHSKEFPRINDASARSGSPSTTSAAAGVDQLLVRCCDALQTVFTDLGFTSPASLLPGCAEARAELLLMRLKALHAEICARQDFSPSSEPITHPFQASTGSMLDRAAPMSSARTDMSPASNQASFPPVKVPNSASKRRGYTITSHIRSSTDYSGFSSSGSDVRQANQPGAHGPAPSAFDDDQVIGKNGRLFDKRNKLQRWLLWKPDQLQSRAAQCKRDAKERGVKAVDIALQQYEEYQAKERLEYEAIWAELQTALADSPAPLEPFTAAWAKLGQAEESFKQLLDKLHEQYADAKVVSASISPKCDEARTIIEETTRAFNLVESALPAGDLRKITTRCFTLDAWCRFRKFVSLEDDTNQQLVHVKHAETAEGFREQVKCVLNDWDALVDRFNIARDKQPRTELQGYIQLVHAILELTRCITDRPKDPKVSYECIIAVYDTVLPSYQQLVSRMKDIEVDEDCIPALETLCDEVSHFYQQSLKPTIEGSSNVERLTEAVATMLMSSLKLKSRHLPKYPHMVSTALKETVRKEISPTAQTLPPQAIEDILKAAPTTSAFARQLAVKLLKTNNAHPGVDSPRTSLDSLFTFYGSRLAAHSGTC